MATEYYVLRRDASGFWQEIDGAVRASNDLQAIKLKAKDQDAEAFVAVPVRSWRPRTRKVETQQLERWS